jgi:hypothetical protein
MQILLVVPLQCCRPVILALSSHQGRDAIAQKGLVLGIMLIIDEMAINKCM